MSELQNDEINRFNDPEGFKVEPIAKNDAIPKLASSFIGTAGVYHVMSELSLAGFHAAATHGNAPDFDVLVCSARGDITAAIQVKSTLWARRTSTFDFPLSYRAATMNQKNFFVAFVDFAGHENQKPGIYLVSAAALYDACKPWIEKYKGKMIRFKPTLKWMREFKIDDHWQLLRSLGIVPLKSKEEGSEKDVVQPAEADPSTSSG